MKKYFLSILFFVLITVFSGCSFNLLESGSGESMVEESGINDEEKIVVETNKQTSNMMGGELFDIEESEENWHWNESKKYGIKFKFPQKLNFNNSGSIAETARLDLLSENAWIRANISIGDAKPVDSCGDIGYYSFPDAFRKQLLAEKSCDVVESEITPSSPIYFKSGKSYLCDVFVDEEKGQVSLYALGLDNVYGENLTGMIYVAMENRAILLRGQGLVLEKYQSYVSQKLQKMSENNEEVNLNTFIQIQPNNNEIQEFLSQENMDFMKKIASTVKIHGYDVGELYDYQNENIYEEVLLYDQKYGFDSKNKHVYKKYINNDLGISFIYNQYVKSYIDEKDGKLSFMDYSEKKDEYYSYGQDYIEIYEKNTEESFEDAVKRIILEQIDSLEDCNFQIEEQEDGSQKLFVIYKNGFVYDENACLPEENIEGGPWYICNNRQRNEYNQKAIPSCSNFEQGGWMNYFIYQPNNTNNKIAFRRHVSGLDAEPWDVESIELFD